MIEDSGNRRQFESGAVRDIVQGKGRCDLMPLDVVGLLLEDAVILNVHDFVANGGTKVAPLMDALKVIAETEYTGNLQAMIHDVSHHYEEGALKYGERNWEKGIPLHSFIDSGVRHWLTHTDKDSESQENHLRACVWNLLGALWTVLHRPELNDLPKDIYTKEVDA